MGRRNITPLFYSQMHIADRNRLFIAAEGEQLQIALMEMMVTYEKYGSY